MTWGLIFAPCCNGILYVYILIVVALDEINISSCLHFTMQIIELSCDL